MDRNAAAVVARHRGELPVVVHLDALVMPEETKLRRIVFIKLVGILHPDLEIARQLFQSVHPVHPRLNLLDACALEGR